MLGWAERTGRWLTMKGNYQKSTIPDHMKSGLDALEEETTIMRAKLKASRANTRNSAFVTTKEKPKLAKRDTADTFAEGWRVSIKSRTVKETAATANVFQNLVLSSVRNPYLLSRSNLLIATPRTNMPQKRKT